MLMMMMKEAVQDCQEELLLHCCNKTLSPLSLWAHDKQQREAKRGGDWQQKGFFFVLVYPMEKYLVVVAELGFVCARNATLYYYYILYEPTIGCNVTLESIMV